MSAITFSFCCGLHTFSFLCSPWLTLPRCHQSTPAVFQSHFSFSPLLTLSAHSPLSPTTAWLSCLFSPLSTISTCVKGLAGKPWLSTGLQPEGTEQGFHSYHRKRTEAGRQRMYSSNNLSSPEAQQLFPQSTSSTLSTLLIQGLAE